MSLLSEALKAVAGPKTGFVSQEGQPRRIIGSVVALGENNNTTPFIFTEMEVPQGLEFGKKQLYAAHNFIEGGKAVDLYGVDTPPLQLQGELFNLSYAVPQVTLDSGAVPKHEPGESAMQRMQRLASMAATGKRLVFHFHTFRFQCVVVDAKFNAHHWNHVTYSLTLEVLEDNVLTQGAPASAKYLYKLNETPNQSFFRAATAFMQTSTKLMQSAQQSINLLGSVLTAVNTDPKSLLFKGVRLVPGASDAIALAASARVAHDAWIGLNDLHAQTTLDLLNAQPYNTLAPDAYTKYLRPNAAAYKSKLEEATAFFYNYWPALRSAKGNEVGDPAVLSALLLNGQRTRSNLARMMLAMDKILLPTRTRTRVYKDPDLAKVALEVYGDPAKWQEIATANGLKNKDNVGVFRLVLPYFDDANGSGATLAPTPSAGV